MNKVRIIITTDRIYFELCQSILHMNQIQFQSKNTVDSMLNAFGSFEIYVAEEDQEKAIDILDNHEKSSNS
jgi:hypothetical protein